MANTKSAAKRAKQAEQRRQHNVALRARHKSRLNKAIKKLANAAPGSEAAATKKTATKKTAGKKKVVKKTVAKKS